MNNSRVSSPLPRANAGAQDATPTAETGEEEEDTQPQALSGRELARIQARRRRKRRCYMLRRDGTLSHRGVRRS